MTAIHLRRLSLVSSGALVVLMNGAAIAPGGAQARRVLTVDVGECVDLARGEERLACFDAQVERAREGGAAPRATGAASVAEGARAGEAISALEAAPVQRPADGGDRLRGRDSPSTPLVVAGVTELRQTVPNAFLITLDNGQLWRQVQPLRYRLRVGMQVQIYAPSLGKTLRLKTDDLRGYIQVERVR
jgi:hypothetical protein